MIEDAKVDGKSVLYSLNAPRKTCNNGKPGCKVVRNLLLACFTEWRFCVMCQAVVFLVVVLLRLARIRCRLFPATHAQALDPGTINLVTGLSDA
jgi:hypothetical protein